jgi:SAM-dependent methyltransferase
MSAVAVERAAPARAAAGSGNGAAAAAKRWLAGGWLDPLHVAKRSLARAMRRAAPRLSGRLLDIGCGVKPYAPLLGGVTRYIGIERPGTLSRSGVVDCWADALALPFADAAFDSVLCNEVLEHVTDPARLFAEAARVLRPGGTLVLSTPQTWGLHEEPHDYWRFTRYGLAHLARGAGLTVEEIVPTCGLFATVGQRLASFLFYGTPARRVPVLNLLVRPFLALLQLVGVGLDELAGRRGDPLDHVLVARR